MTVVAGVVMAVILWGSLLVAVLERRRPERAGVVVQHR